MVIWKLNEEHVIELAAHNVQELVKEKIKNQELYNQLEKLNQELEFIGINRQKLEQAEHSQGEK